MNTAPSATLNQNSHLGMAMLGLLVSMIPFLFSGALINVFFVAFAIGFLFKHKVTLLPLQKFLSYPLIIACGCFVVWAFLTTIWSLNPEKTLLSCCKILVISTLGLFVSEILFSFEQKEWRTKANLKTVFWILIAVSALMNFEHLTHYKISLFFRHLLDLNVSDIRQPLDKGTALYTILLPFFLSLFYSHKKALSALILLNVITYALHPMFAAAVAFGVSLFIVGAVHLFGRIIIKIFFSLTIFTFLFIPHILGFIIHHVGEEAISSLPATWTSRIHIWETSISFIAEKPWTGWGIKSTNNIESTLPHLDKVIELHPHNMPLQIYLETGFIGALIIATIFFIAYKKIMTIQNTRFLAPLLGGLSAYLTFSFFSFGAWQTWWMSSSFIMIATTGLFSSEKES